MLKKDKLSPANKKKAFIKIRKNIDKIDDQILNLLFKRKKQVINIIKYKNKKDIVDNKRINQMLKKLKFKGKKKNLEGYLINNVWKSIIKSFIRYEKEKI